MRLRLRKRVCARSERVFRQPALQPMMKRPVRHYNNGYFPQISRGGEDVCGDRNPRVGKRELGSEVTLSTVG